MKRIKESFEGGLRVNTMGTMVFRIHRCQTAAKYVTFYRLHVAYFLCLTCVGTCVLWVVPLTTSKRLSFISALYTCVSAVASTGLQTVESASFTYFHYSALIVLMILGCPPLTSLGPLFVRKYYFHLCMRQVSVERIQQQKFTSHELELTLSREYEMKVSEDRARKLETFGQQDDGKPSKSRSMSSEADLQNPLNDWKSYRMSSDPDLKNPVKYWKSYRTCSEQDLKDPVKHSRSYSINSEADLQHHVNHLKSYSMSSEADLQNPVNHLKSYSMSSVAEMQRHAAAEVQFECAEELERKGRVFVDAQQALRTLEYRALVTLTWLVVRFLFAVALIGFLLGALYFITVGEREVRILQERGINPYFYALYNSISAFTNGGYSCTNDNMIAFVGSSGILILYAVLASVGNALYSPVMRLLVWISYKRAPDREKSVYDYLLKHPRRCYTYLFPKYQTLWLLGAYFFMTAIQIIFMCILEWHGALQGLNTTQKLVASYFQGVGTRNAGGLVVNLSQLAPALLFIFVACMYMAVYPVVLSRQTTHVQETEDYDDTNILLGKAPKKTSAEKSDHAVLVNQSRRLLARDTPYLVLAMFVLCLSESRNIRTDPLNFSIFNIIFEITSAYGNIGISVGYDCGLRLDQDTPCRAIPYSFSGAWSIVGRLVIIVIMFLGRHRGLADNIDSAIRLPAKIVPYTVPSTPRRNSSVSNAPLIFPWNGDDNQMELVHSPNPSTHDASHTPPPIHSVTLNLSFRLLPSNPTSASPNPTLASPPALALPTPVVVSETETPEVPISAHAPNLSSSFESIQALTETPPSATPPLTQLTTSETEQGTDILTCKLADDPLSLPSENTPTETSTSPILPFPPPLQKA